MDVPTLLASVGVSLLLIAFFLDMFDYISDKSLAYLLLNVAGAAIACYASYLIQFIPFIILEGIWSAVAMVGLIRKFQ
jgi:hypothetical protein